MRTSSRGLALVLVALSGATALAYQVIWERLLRLYFGADEVTAVLITSTFLLGLGGGAYLFGRRYRHPLRAYAFLELGIGLFGLASAPLLHALARAVQTWAGGSLAHSDGVRLASLLGVVPFVLVPTLMMGGTAPLLFACFADEDEGAPRLYGANTIGAMAGAVLAPVVLLHTFRVPTALAVTASCNLALAVLLFIAHRRTSARAIATSRDAPPERRALVLAFVSAALVLGWELVALRHLGHLHSGSPYNLALVLGLYLAALGAGSWAVRRRDDDHTRPLARAFALACASIVVTPVACGAFMQTSAVETARPVALLLYVALLVFPFAFVQGGVFPRLLEPRGATHESLPTRAGPLHLASACGAFSAGLTLHFLGWDLLGLRGVTIALVALGAAVVALLTRDTQRWRWLVLAVAALIGAIALPRATFATLAYGQRVGATWDGVEGQTGTAMIAWRNELRMLGNLWVHGKPFGALPIEPTWRWASTFVHARASRARVLVLGLGTGTVLRALVDDPAVEHVDVVDWSHELPTLLRREPARGMTGAALDSPKVRLHRIDARTAVALADPGAYDAVFESLTHYGPVGSTSYRSVEYYRELHRVLAPNGVLVSVGVARAQENVIATALTAFRHVSWFAPFCIIAGDDAQLVDDDRLREVVRSHREAIGSRGDTWSKTPRVDFRIGDLAGSKLIHDDDLAGEFSLGSRGGLPRSVVLP